MKLTCRFGWHDWLSWSDWVQISEITRSGLGVTETEKIMGQEIQCKDCRRIHVEKRG